jgi:predicted RNA-binding protein YlqC (UPF0109 family)
MKPISRKPMTTRISEIADSLRQLGDIQVSEWDFKALLNKDIKDLEIGSSLRKLGNRKVMDWDFKTALPAVHKIAHQEVDLVGWVKRAAQYKVIDWDFRGASDDDGGQASAASRRLPDAEEQQELMVRLRSFLHFTAVNLIDEPEQAEIRIQEIGPGAFRFKLVVTPQDLKVLIGREGATGAAIRNLLKMAALEKGVHVLLQIISHEEERALRLKEGGSGAATA